MTGGARNRRQRKLTPPRRVVVRGIRRDEVDARKLARALIALIEAQAESEAQAQHETKKRRDSSDD
jgi:hypothetical protein